jgi:hypothetical protein
MSRSTSCQVASCPVMASGRFTPLSAIQSMSFSHSPHFHHAMLYAKVQ